MHHLHLNPWPLLVCTVFLWLLGAAWYSPVLFVKPWMAALGITPGAPNKKILLVGMISSLVGDFLLVFAMDHIVYWTNASTVHWGAFLGFLVWLGFFAAPNFPQGIYERRPFKLFVINNGYWLVGLLVVGIVLAVWR